MVQRWRPKVRFHIFGDRANHQSISITLERRFMLSSLRKISMTQWILIAMALGTLVGWASPDVAQHLKPLSTIFLRMIKSLIAPLIFATLVIGIAGHGDDMTRVGRLALMSLLCF